MSTRDDNDPERFRWLAEGNARQARKRVSAKVVIRDERGRILLVNPTYKDFWDLPGGMAEANESPTTAARREVREELGYDVRIGPLLAVEWVDAHGPWDDLLLFIFDGGVIADAEASGISITDTEISEFAFFPLETARESLRTDVWQALTRAMAAGETGRTDYTERRPRQ